MKILSLSIMLTIGIISPTVLATDLAVTASGTESHVDRRIEKSINFGFGGATTNTANATTLMAPILDDLAGAIGLELIGLSHQLDFAEAVTQRAGPNDLFWVWAGTNNILIGLETGNIDPTKAATEIKVALARLHKNLGARNFVVPNLMLLGNIPKFNQDPEAKSSINQLTVQHNKALQQVLSEFKAEHPEVVIYDLDVQSLFSQMEVSGEFTNTTNACFFHGLPRGIPCEQYLYADDIHFSSAAAARVAELAMAELSNVRFTRLLTLGDSFVDTGSFSNTIKRAAGFDFPPFPFWEGRFTDGPNVIDHLTQDLNIPSASESFAQPVRREISEGTNEINREMIVPGHLTLESESRFGLVTLHVANQVTCFYWPDWQVDGHRALSFCSKGLKAGDKVEAANVTLLAPFSQGSVSTDIFVY